MENSMLARTPLVAFVPTSDFTRARAFYEKKLGLRLKSKDNFAMVFDAHGIMLRVVKVENHVPAAFTILGWQVKGMERLVKQLKARKVMPEIYPWFEQQDGIWTAPSGDKVVWFKDPDGNTLSLSEHVAVRKARKKTR
jgi:catechol 2,3-dioxygenase-like lactoylglutathione lyase family enzyme